MVNMMSLLDILYWYLVRKLVRKMPKIVSMRIKQPRSVNSSLSDMLTEPTANFMLPISPPFRSTVNHAVLY